MNSASENFTELFRDDDWSGNEINIRVYANEANVKEIENLFSDYYELANNKHPARSTLFLYTNMDKYNCTYSQVDPYFQLQWNPRASRRERTEQNFIYVLSQHGRAATAALGFISEQLTRLVVATEPVVFAAE